MNGLGVLNSNSQMKDYARDLKRKPVQSVPEWRRQSVTLGDLEVLAIQTAAKMNLALFHECETAVSTHEANLAAIAEYIRMVWGGTK